MLPPARVLRAFFYTLVYPVSYCTNLAGTVMKSLLRRKTPTDHVQKPSPPSSVSNIRQSSNVETPLYARFASTKQAVQPQERSRIVVSGPMPLGRPNRANIEADDNRRKREDGTVPRLKLSNGRQGTPPGPQSLRNSFSGSRGVQSSLDGSYQDVRVHMAQAARPPIKVQAPCKSSFLFPIVIDMPL